MKTELPEYVDGNFKLYDIITEKINDFPVEKIKSCDMAVCYNEISIFDHTRHDFHQAGIDVTKKIRIPRYDKITSDCVCIIDGVQHRVYNATGIVNKNGFKETEITLRKPEKEYEVVV